MKTHLPKAQAFYYAFNHTGIPEGLALAHATYVKTAISNLFDISLDAVKVVSEDRLDDDAPFRLTAYESKSRTSDVAGIYGYRIALRHLALVKAKAADCLDCLAEWVPGEDAGRDEQVLEYVANGYADGLSFAQRTWLSGQADAFGVGSGDIDRMTDKQLAAVVLTAWLHTLLFITNRPSHRFVNAHLVRLLA